MAAVEVPTPAAPAVDLDMSDPSSSALLTKAWQNAEAGNPDAAIAYTNKVIEIYNAQALEQQAATTTKPTEKEAIFALWALNDVATAYFIKGQILEKQGKKNEAVEAFKFVSEKLPMAQCLDPEGWFWSPADAATARLQKLEVDAM